MKSLREDINKRIAEYDADLKRISLGLLNPEEQRALLSKICEDMFTITGEGVKGTNRDAEFFCLAGFESADGPARFLRGRIREENKTFHKEVMSNGHTVDYAWGPDEPPPESFDQVERFHRFLVGTVGTELPSNFDPHRLNPLFVHYSQPWKDHAKDYLDRAYYHAREFVKLVVNMKLGKALPEVALRFRQHVLEDRLEEQKRKADTELAKIELDRSEDVVTEDMRYLAETTNRLAIRLSRRIAKAGGKDAVVNETPEHTATALGLGDPESRQEAAMKMFEEMLIYYRVSVSEILLCPNIKTPGRSLLILGSDCSRPICRQCHHSGCGALPSQQASRTVPTRLDARSKTL